MEKLISVIVPVFNTDKYLDKCIKSILESEDTDFELLLIDDGSTDSSALICKNYRDADPRVKYYYQSNMGVSVARNYGIKKAKGQWIIFIDSDDEITSDYFSLIRKNADSNVDMLLFDTCWYGKENDKSDLMIKFVSQDKIDMITKAILSMSLIDGRKVSARSPAAKVYRKKFILQNQIEFPNGIAIGEDELFNIQVYSRLNLGYYCPNTVYYVNYRENSTMHRFHNNYYDQTSNFYKELKRVLQKQGLYERLSIAYHNNVLSGIVAILKNYIFHKENGMSNKDRRNRFLLLREEPMFKEAIKQNWKVGSFKRKILIWFVKYNQYTIMKLFFHFYNLQN